MSDVSGLDVSGETRHAPDIEDQVDNWVDLLRHRARQQPDRATYTFLTFAPDRSEGLTNGELDRRARMIAVALGPCFGEKVLLLFPPGLDYLAAFFGCLYAGAVAVPAYPPNPNRMHRSMPRVMGMIEDADIDLVLTNDVIAASLERLQGELPRLAKMRRISLENLDPDLAEHWEAPDIGGDTLAFLQYTSGSTATPKGVQVSHGNLLHNESVIRKGFATGPQDRVVSWLPMYHDMGLIGSMLHPLFLGARCYFMAPMDFLRRPYRWLEAVHRFQATVSGGPNFAYDLCVRKIPEEDKARLDLSSWQVAFNGAEPVRAETLEAFTAAFRKRGFQRKAFYPCYGLAEATLFVSGPPRDRAPRLLTVASRDLERGEARVPADDEPSQTFVSNGACFQNVRIVNPERGRPLAEGRVGEIWIEGRSVAGGYLGKPGVSASVFAARLVDGAGPYLRTGDLGFLRDGELYVTGRQKDLIIIRGRNLYPQDIERTVDLAGLDDLHAGCGAAFSVTHEGEERLVVVWEVVRRPKTDSGEIVDTIRELIAETHEVQPHAVVLIRSATIPKTSSGKIRRRACKQSYLEDGLKTVYLSREQAPVQPDHPQPPASAACVLEATDAVSRHHALRGYLRGKLAELLDQAPEKLSEDKPMTALGLDSISAVELQHAVETDLDRVLPMTDFLDGLSIAEVSRQIQDALEQGNDEPPLVPVGAPLGRHPLSHGQRALWFLSNLHTDSAAYNIARAVRLPRTLDENAFSGALKAWMTRHPMLRTTFGFKRGEPFQEVHRDLPLPLEMIDARSLPEAELRSNLADLAHQPFGTGALFRLFRFLREREGDILLMVIHHAAADFWSLARLMEELGQSYSALRMGRKALNQPPDLGFVDYVQWQDELLAGRRGDLLWQFWRKALPADPEALHLPTDKPRPKEMTENGAVIHDRLAGEAVRRLDRLSEETSATRFAVLMTAWQVLLSRYSGQSEIISGTPAMGRSRAGLAELVGYFVNPVPVYSNLSGNPAFRDAVGLVRRSALGAFTHADFPFPLLVERLQPDRDPSYSPIFQNMLVYQSRPPGSTDGVGAFALGEEGAAMKLGTLRLESVGVEQRVTQFDLTLVVGETGADQLSLALEYNTDLFEARSMERLLSHWKLLLEEVTDRPEQGIHSVNLLPKAERDLILNKWNRTYLETPRDRCLHHLFQDQAARSPDRIALVFNDRQLSFAELDCRANQLAHALIRHGVRPGSHVGVCLPRGIDMIIAVLGVLKAGSAYVPLDPTHPADRLQYIADNAEVHLLLVHRKTLGEWGASGLDLLVLDACEDRDRLPLENPGIAVQPADACYLIYTSGSTGRPKGVTVSHGALVNTIQSMYVKPGIGPGERLLAVITLAFDMAAFEIYLSLLYGGTLVVAPQSATVDGFQLAETISKNDITLLQATPATWQMLYAGGWQGKTDLRAVTGGEALSFDLARKMTGSLNEVWDQYGPTEAAIYGTRGRVYPGETLNIGTPVHNAQAYILDGQGNPVPIGVPGELYLGGAGLAQGYWKRPALTAAVFVPNPFAEGRRMYRTGDLVRYFSDSRIQYLGRLDHQVKIRGFRIELGEIETELVHIAEVKTAVVTAHKGRAGSRRLVAYVVPVSDESPDEEFLRGRLRRNLPDYMVPADFVFLTEMPLTPNGKVDRRALPAPKPHSEGMAYTEPRNWIESRLASIWSEVLNLEEVSVTAGFFDLGGHSLSATRAVSRIRESFDLDVPVRRIFLSPTVAELAAWIAESTQTSGGPALTRRNEDKAPLSFAQQRMWLLEQFERDNPAYYMPASLHLHGPLDPYALEVALTALAARQDALRTVMTDEEGNPQQLVLPASPIVCPLTDLSDLHKDRQEAELAALISREHTRPFDLSTGPLWRAALFRLGDRDHRVSMTMHHMISDGWSIGVFIHELAALYRAALECRDPSSLEATAGLNLLSIRYTDFSYWQRQYLSGSVLDGKLAYWTHKLAGIGGLLKLPLDKPRPALQSFHGAGMRFSLDAELTAAYDTFCKSKNMTLFMALEAVFALLLSRYSGEEDILVGTPVANRNMAQIEPLIGFFVNTLVLRNDLSGDPDFHELLNRVSQTALDAYDHQDLPFERVVEAVAPERQLSYNPVFQVMFILQNAPEGAPTLEGLDVTLLKPERTYAKFDLTLELVPNGDRLDALLEYNTDLFLPATITRLADHFRVLARELITQPGLPVSQASLMGAEERRLVLVEWNRTQAAYPSEKTIADLIAESIAANPNEQALVCCDSNGEITRMSYRQLNIQVNRMTTWLLDMGIGPDTPVGICMNRTAEMVTAMLAVQRAGGAYVPMDPAYPHERIAYTIADAGLKIMLSQSDLLDMLPGNINKIALDLPGAMWRHAPPIPITGPARPENLSHIIYTSGSTGRPKGVAIRHRGSTAMISWMGQTYRPEHLQGVLAATSICFDLSVFEIMGTLSHGGCVYLGENALAPATLPVSEEITLINTVPSALTELLNLKAVPKSARIVNLAGEPLRGELVRRIYGLGFVEAVYNLYGPSEDTTYSTWARIDRDAAYPPIGRPLSNTRAYLLDKHGQPVPMGHNGELFLAGDGLARGYYGKPGQTASRFVPDPYSGEPGSRQYRTGDLARYLPNGEMLFSGRVDHQVKLRGFRIELGEIEVALRKNMRVQDAVVIIREDNPADPRLTAYVTPAGGPHDELAGLLRANLRQHLPDYMVPAAIVALEQMPLTPNGKIDRNALPVPADSVRTAAQIEPTNHREVVLARIWCEVLNLERVGIHDNFFDLGGHSLLATRICSRASAAFSLDVSVRRLFQTPTIASLAAWIEKRSPEEAPQRITRLPDEATAPLSFAQQRMWLLAQMEPGNPVYHMPAGLRLRGPLNLRALETALTALADRQTALRTVVAEAAGIPCQHLLPIQPIQLVLTDLSGLDRNRAEAAATELALREHARPFDLTRGPLMRVAIFRGGGDDHWVAVTMHHLIADGWSVGIFIRELSALYNAALFDRPERVSLATAAALPDLDIRYRDFAHWQRDRLGGSALEGKLAYWTKNLAGIRGLLELPLDKPRPAVQTFNGADLRFTLDETLAGAFETYANQRGITLFMALEAVFALLMGRYSGEEDILVGTPVAGRNTTQIEPLIGFFVNTLVLRNDLSGDPSFNDLAKQVSQTALDAYDHQDIPFEHLVETVAPERQLSYNPVFQVMFILQNAPESRLDLHGLEVNLEEPKRTHAKFDLTLELMRGDNGLNALLEYNTDLFLADSMIRLAEHFLVLAAELIARPELPVSQASLMGAEERQKILEEWNQTDVAYPHRATIADLIARSAADHAQAQALVFREANGDITRMTYAQFIEQVQRMSSWLRDLGVGPDVPVGICMNRTPDMITAMAAVQRAGGAYVPMDPLYPVERIAYTITDAGLSLVLTQEDLEEMLPEDVDKPALDSPEAAWRNGSPNVADCPAGPEHLSHIIYTSGSTGLPKGVAIRHKSSVAMIAWTGATYRPEHFAGVLAGTSICFDLSVYEIMGTLCHGGSVYLVENALALADLPVADEITLINTVPSAMSELLHLNAVPTSVRIVNLAGEPLRGELVRDIYDLRFVEAVYNLYGPSEDTTYSTWARIPGDEPYPPIGRPLDNTRAYLLDKTGRPVPIGHRGELFLAGDGLARGYYGKAAMTAARFVPDPFSREAGARLYRTGDLVRYLTDGQMVFTGRVDHQVKLRGFRIELSEIEVTLRKHQLVDNALVMVREDQPGNQQLTGYVTAVGNPSQDLADRLRADLQAHLPGYMVPSALVVLEEMPLTPNGKIDRGALPAPAVPAAETDETPATHLENELRLIWSEVLNVPPPGIHTNFFDLGGHSLSATRVVSRIREEYGADLPLKIVFQTGTIARLAEVLEKALCSGEQVRQTIPVLPREGNLELSFAQSRLWFLSQLAPRRATAQNAAYNIPVLLRLKGRPRIALLEAALNRIAERHESLRTRFTSVTNKPVQLIDDPAPVSLAVIDLSGRPKAETEAQQLTEHASQRPFDLETGPLWRALLIRLEPAEHLLFLEQHHIISDGWSLGVWITELKTLYGAGARLEHLPGSVLPALPLQYPDFAGMQQQRLRSGGLDHQLRYWQHLLNGIPELLELPLDRPRPAVQTFVGDACRRRYDSDLVAPLQAVCRQAGATLFMGLEALFAHLLGRWSNSEDVVVGTPVANRNRAELEPMIGFFVNTLPLRNDLSGNPSFRVLLERTRLMTLETYAHQDVPFERLVDSLALTRSLSHTPVFQVVFALQNTPRESLELPGLHLDVVEQPVRTAKFDLSFMMVEEDGGLELSLEYNTDLFDHGSMQRLAEHFGNLIRLAPASLDLPLGELSLMSAAEKQKVLHTWNNTATEDRSSDRIHEHIAAHAARAPRAEALVFVDQSGPTRLSYGRLAERAGKLAHLLRTRGVGPETIVGICTRRSPEMVTAMWAVLQTGAAYLPIDPTYPADRKAYMIEDSGISIILTTRKLADDSTASARERILVDDPATTEGMPSDLPVVAVHADNTAYVIYTSGSTGRPKGVCLTHRGFTNQITECIRFLRMTPEGRMLQFASFSFDASVLETFTALAAGGALYLAPRNLLLPGPLLQDFMQTHRITHTLLSPTAASRLDADALDSLETLAVGGEASSAALVNRFVKKHRMVNAYGPTEATIVATMYELTETDRNPPIGAPLGNYRTYVLDRSGRPVPIGIPGELYVGGIGTARGYLGKPGLTAERFVPDSFSGDSGGRLYRTGDLVRFTGEGETARIEYLGRIDHQVKLRGFRIELGEIESVLNSDPMVRESVILVREDRPGDQRLTAYAVLSAKLEADRDPTPDLRNYLKERLPDFMVPSAFVYLDMLPMTPGGKVDRTRLPKPVHAAAGNDYKAAASGTERIIEAAWREVLGLEKVGIHDNFFEIGGHSILVVELHGKLQTALERQFALVRLFEHPTIAALAAWLDQGADDTGETAKEAVERGSSRRQALKTRKRRRRR
ncbi:MAG: non-ribosomal peptide synthase/polyketide synthase [Acidobacteriota bacterium]|nr:non-ribosomal peptide synthase/polyketide synthase [Acidobacteriota bacterium]